MIYFDQNKQAYAYEITEPLCTISNEQWTGFCTLTLGVEYDITSDGIIDLRESEEYIAKQTKNENAARIAEIKSKLNALDVKRIRAMLEPSVKDETTGETWLEYYNAQVFALREELNQLNGIVLDTE